jgi:hypothetical protein
MLTWQIMYNKPPWIRSPWKRRNWFILFFIFRFEMHSVSSRPKRSLTALKRVWRVYWWEISLQKQKLNSKTECQRVCLREEIKIIKERNNAAELHNRRLEPWFLSVINVTRWKIGGSPEIRELLFAHRDLQIIPSQNFYWTIQNKNYF